MSYGEQAAQAPIVKTIPNNSGTTIGSSPAPGNAPTRTKSPGLLGSVINFLKDIEQGFLGGGYSAPVSDQSGGTASSGTTKAPSRIPASERLDLKKYLPGGRFGPVGRERPGGTQIHGRSVDIWARITVRMREKCMLGRLFDCR